MTTYRLSAYRARNNNIPHLARTATDATLGDRLREIFGETEPITDPGTGETVQRAIAKTVDIYGDNRFLGMTTAARVTHDKVLIDTGKGGDGSVVTTSIPLVPVEVPA